MVTKAQLEKENETLRKENRRLREQLLELEQEKVSKPRASSSKPCKFCGRMTKKNYVSAGGVGPMCQACFDDMCVALTGSY